ncbi:hypothetical protein [Methylobacterium fujisawaense]
MPFLIALLVALAPIPALAAAGASAGESAAMILRTVGAALQLLGFLVVATTLWRIAMPSSDPDRRLSKLIALLMIGAVMVGGPESAGMGMFSRTAADVPETARPTEATASSPMGTAVDPTAPTILDDAGFWGSLNKPVGGVRAEGVARISILQIILSVMAVAALLILTVALRVREGDGEDGASERGKAAPVRSAPGRRDAGRQGGPGGSPGGDTLVELVLRIREWLHRWYHLTLDALLEAKRRLEIFARKVGLITRTEGGAAAVAMVMTEVRSIGDDVSARFEGLLDKASDRRLSQAGASARAVANAGWILRSHSLPGGRAAVGDLVARVGAVLGERADPEKVAERLAYVLHDLDLGATEIWVERVEDRYYLADPTAVASGLASLRRVDALRVDWIESAAAWCLRPKGRREIRPRRVEPEIPDQEGTTPSTGMRIRSMLAGLKGKIVQ